MSSKGGYAAPPPRHIGDRFYNPPTMRRQGQILFLQQQQMMQMQLLQQQQLQMQKRQMQMMSVAGEAESSSVAESSKAVALSMPPSVAIPTSNFEVTNLDRLMESVTPFISVQYLSESNGIERKPREVDRHPFFSLEALWESFDEWSAYGAGVPLLLNGKDTIKQYYVPFLSGIQLYTDPSKASSQLKMSTEESDAESCRLTISSSGSEAEVDNFPRLPLFQFLEHEPPHNRRPLVDKTSLLASQYPELSKYRSCDLLPTSWICVAWYPIYRIPIGPTLQELDMSFLTFHSLSTQSKSNNSPPQFHAPNTREVHGTVDPTAKISLPVFALASYKLKGSIVSPCGPECEQENSFLKAADDWLKQLQVNLPDYQFFRAHYSYRR